MGKVQVEADIPQVVNYVATSVTIGTTTILEPNTPATVTNSGTAQNAVLNFGIPSTSADFSGYRTAAAQDIIDATKQPKTLSTAITVNGVSKTTVEDALNAINENTAIADTNLSNLTETGEAHFAKPNLSNVSTTSGFRKLSEVYVNGTSWYKVFDEYDPATGYFVGKWCEQGGIGQYNNQDSITLLKSFADTNYSVQATFHPASYSYAYISVYDKSTSDFKISIVQGTGGTYGIVCWEAKGYLPSGD